MFPRSEFREDRAPQDNADQVNRDHRRVGAGSMNRDLAERIDRGTIRKGGCRRTSGQNIERSTHQLARTRRLAR